MAVDGDCGVGVHMCELVLLVASEWSMHKMQRASTSCRWSVPDMCFRMGRTRYHQRGDVSGESWIMGKKALVRNVQDNEEDGRMCDRFSAPLSDDVSDCDDSHADVWMDGELNDGPVQVRHMEFLCQ